jgi:group II intron reverse transcriptase/maturase
VRDPKIKALIRKWLKAGILEGGKVAEARSGTPQGGVLSPLLSNIYLHEFDRKWKGWHGQLVRYADDMVILCRTRGEAERALDEVRRIIGELGLTLNEEKTKIRHAGEGFDFLGFTFREKYSKMRKRKVMVKFPKSKSMEKIKRKLKEIVKKIPLGSMIGEAVEKLNPVIRGWVNYFRIGNSYAEANEVSNEACRQLRIFWRRKKQDKRCIGYAKWKNRFFYERGLIYAPAYL